MRNHSIMWDYIAEEPEALARLMKSEQISVLAREELKDKEGLYFVAHGSSWNAALTAEWFLARAGGLRVRVDTPAGFLYQDGTWENEKQENILVAFISQTGTSRGVLEALEETKKRGYRTLGITAEKESPLAEKADSLLLLECGKEESNAKTKGYSATLLALFLLGLETGKVKGKTEESYREKVKNELTEQIRQIPEVSETVKTWCEENDFGRNMKEVFVLGYGMNFGTAAEGQLKLLETQCVPAMFTDAGEFSHGMHRAVTGDSSVLLLQSVLPLQSLAEVTLEYLKETAREVLMLDASGKETAREHRIRIPEYPLTQSVLLLTAAVQTLAAAIPEINGKDPNRDSHDDFTRAAGTRV